MSETHIREVDTALVATAKRIKVLNALAWPAGADEEFLREWWLGRPRLPSIRPSRPMLGSAVGDLEAIATRCDCGPPVERFLADTARSYAEAGRMISALCTTDFTRHSVRIYGRPDHIYKTQGWLKPPVYIPTWADDLRRLAGMMAYSSFITKVRLDAITLDRAIAFEDELLAESDTPTSS